MKNRTSAGAESRALRASRTRIGASLLVAIGAALGGCGQSHIDFPDAAQDAALDRPDSTSAEGGGPEPDGGLADGDADGIPSDLDCDDADPSVGSTSTRSWTTDCGVGAQRCAEGAWGACDGSTDCACPTVGMTRTVTCGRCGLASQTCEADLTWTVPGECLGEAECFEGDVEREMERCGDRARICDATCHWRDWTETVPPGECEAGTVSRTGDGCAMFETREMTCSSACAWEETMPCALTCSRPAQTSRTGADPVCIPGGPFALGSNDEEAYAGRYERRIILSEYYIDRYPVTRARYEMCRAAGVCPDPDAASAARYDAIPIDGPPGWLPQGAGEAFCTWDGGTLATEFQWEKAARGPWPDRRLDSWGATPPDLCRVHAALACFDNTPPIAPATYPDANSPYGVRMLGSFWEVTSTWISAANEDHRWLSDDTVDPLPPATGTQVLRGRRWCGLTVCNTSSYSAVDRERFRTPVASTFRCAY